ncbi:helix-turn-helix domain-containing protein [Thalassobius sp. I31.1]|uniref:GlxA family transcriptional regulator n=1 Tax=Thalassobius sp. I31.1 TaxID=2109912 RepID=UPI000D198C59|nr:helix-turn-helix domain-containing protein [Thalassobius sp. I31.1]
MTYSEPRQTHAMQTAGQTLQQEIYIILPEDASAASAHMVSEVFRTANELISSAPYRITVRSLSAPVDNDPRQWQRRTVIFLGDLHSRWHIDAVQRSRLQQILRLAPRNLVIGSAIFLLAAGGLNLDHKLAIHPNFLAAAHEMNLQEETPGGRITNSGRIKSAISSFAALPLLIGILQQDQGHFLADAISEYLGLNETRKNPSKAFVQLRQSACDDTLIVNALKVMQEHIEDPLKIREIASIVGVSTRQLERRFQEKAGVSPLPAYRALRLERAQQLLQHTSLSLPEIAVATGFGTRCNLTRWFNKELNNSPQNMRQQSFTGAAA